MLEGYTTLGFVAAITEQVRLGLLVTGVTYRHPGLLAKTVTTLDVLSRGRAMLGIGAAWYEREHPGLGVPFPPIKERFERLEETLQIARRCGATTTGRSRASTTSWPRPSACRRRSAAAPADHDRRQGERKTLRLVAKYADACNLFGDRPTTSRTSWTVLRGHCDDAGHRLRRDREDVIVGADPAGDPDAFLAAMVEDAALGIPTW